MRLIQTARNSEKGICSNILSVFVTFTSFYEFVKLPNRRELHLATTQKEEKFEKNYTFILIE